MKKFLLPLAMLAMLAVLAGAAGTAQATDQVPTVVYEWTPPTERENGQPLEPHEIGGYELRVSPESGEPMHILIPDPTAISYEFVNHPAGDYSSVIAVYDTNGLYSNFVEITGTVNAVKPMPPSEFRSRQMPFASALEKCLVERLCQVYDPSKPE